MAKTISLMFKNTPEDQARAQEIVELLRQAVISDEQKQRELIDAGWVEGEGEDAGWWWKYRAGGWARTLDEAYDCLVSGTAREASDEPLRDMLILGKEPRD